MATKTILPKCLALLGITLLGSSLLKGLSPAQAVSWLSSTGLDVSTSLLLVPLLAVFEAFVGVSLLFYSHCRWTRIGALMFFLGIVCARISALLANANSDCGCFGSLTIPSPLLWTFLIAGILITAFSLRQGPPPGPTWHSKIRGTLAALLLGVVSLTTFLQVSNVQQPTTWQEKIAATSHQRFLIVGATDCPHCHTILAQLPRERLDEIAFLVREDDRGQLAKPSPRLYRIPSTTWWNALEQAPPALFERGRDQPLHRLETTQFLKILTQ